MFTGIIVATGEVVSLSKGGSSSVLRLKSAEMAKDAAPGDSIAINGVCLTVTLNNAAELSFDLSNETISSTNLGQLRRGDRVNLEPALKADGKLGGHFVLGHVDGVGRIRSKETTGDTCRFEIDAPWNVTEYLVEKGSVAIDGISLTVVSIFKESFTIVIIPHTLKMTTMGFKRAGDTVNLEADIIGKYVARFINRDKNGSSLIKTLMEQGYIKE